jgi:hypothetical protein
MKSPCLVIQVISLTQRRTIYVAYLFSPDKMTLCVFLLQRWWCSLSKKGNMVVKQSEKDRVAISQETEGSVELEPEKMLRSKTRKFKMGMHYYSRGRVSLFPLRRKKKDSKEVLLPKQVQRTKVIYHCLLLKKRRRSLCWWIGKESRAVCFPRRPFFFAGIYWTVHSPWQKTGFKTTGIPCFTSLQDLVKSLTGSEGVFLSLRNRTNVCSSQNVIIISGEIVSLLSFSSCFQKDKMVLGDCDGESEQNNSKHIVCIVWLLMRGKTLFDQTVEITKALSLKETTTQ